MKLEDYMAELEKRRPPGRPCVFNPGEPCPTRSALAEHWCNACLLVALLADLARLRDELDAALAGQALLREVIGDGLNEHGNCEWCGHKPPRCNPEDCEASRARLPGAAEDFLQRHRAALAALRGCVQALDKVQWRGPDRCYPDCPWCGAFKTDGHAADCAIHATLAQARAVQGVT